jgi:sugar transferase (PEP-CTERM/EpsH1 system associated)
MNILMLCPYPPFPPHGGGTMRIYQLIRGLAAQHRITCLSFVPDPLAAAALAPLHAFCRVVTVVGPPPRSLRTRAWTTLRSPLPDMALRNAAPAYTAALREMLAHESFDVIQAESIEMAGYLELPATNTRPLLVLDQFNAEYVLQKRAALTSLAAVTKSRKPQAAIRNLVGGLYSLAQWGKLAAYERRVMQQCDAVAAVSEDDARILRELAPNTHIGVVPNGVDTQEFRRELLESPSPLAAGPTVVFSGTLDFRPNIDAITWFAAEVWPLVLARCPNARFVAVGRRAAPALQQLAATGVLTLTGEVADARPYLAGAAVYVVPMRIGGGVRLKLLEALSIAAPVVCTSMGAEGVAELRGGVHCLLADSPADFATATLRLINEPLLGQQLGQAGRKLVCQGYDWSAIIPRLEQIYRTASKIK